ncbi:ERF family protein [Lysobacter niastensis]|uniref:ERF family protein n=1 Tax=Lysobacter niastensis TaxID=380629 RepID=A0ABS0B2V6_9GAMM|nr:ERF family protein [Lysobacter niastensis]MBF6022805.1 ERF family protein [Lysobacter niastensis]
MTDSAPMVYACIAAVMADLAKVGIGKDAVNEHDRYRYRSIDAVLNALSPLLSAHGLVILPSVIGKDLVEREAKSGATLLHVTLTLRYSFIAVADGSRHEIEVMGEASDRADKAVPKAMAAAFKYMCVQVFCIGYESMADADASTEETAGANLHSRQHRGRFPGLNSPAGTAQRAHVPAHEVDATTARWSDEIDEARTVADLDVIATSIKLLPENIRRDLRNRFKDRRDSLVAIERDRADLDARSNITNPDQGGSHVNR